MIADLRCPGCASPLERRGEDSLCCPACRREIRRKEGVWAMEEGFRPGGFPRDRLEGLTRLDEGHFWSEGRDLLALKLLGDAVLETARAAADLGCGTGRFSERLAERGLEVCGFDGHSDLLARAASRGAAVEWIHASLEPVPLRDSCCDLVTALDVLEHVQPAPFLGEAARILKPGGRLLLSVPSAPSLWSRIDEEAGHRCRYTLALLRQEVEGAGLTLERWTHFQFLLFPVVALSRRLGRHHELAGERRHPAWLGRALGAVNHLERRVLGHLSLPVGSSLIARCARAS